MADETKSALSVREAASALGVSIPTLKRYLYAGKVKSYKTPGGHHRIPLAEIARLKGQGRTGSTQLSYKTTRPLPEKASETALEKRLERLETQLGMLQSTLEVLLAFCKHLYKDNVDLVRKQSSEPPTITLEVLGVGCPACDFLAHTLQQVVEENRVSKVKVKRVSDPEEIVAYGPLATPALVQDGRLIASGKVFSKSELLELVRKLAGSQDEA